MKPSLTQVTLNQPHITDFSRARNLKLDQAATDWLFYLDQDEVVSPALQADINRAITDKRFNYRLKRQDVFLGKKLFFGETARVRLTRLVQKGSGRWQGKVHETFVSRLPLRTLKHPLLHQPRLSLAQFMDKLDFYSSLRAEEINTFSLWQLVLFPPLKFIHNFFFRLGFLDGQRGLIMAFMMSFHSLLVRIKVYEKQS